MKVFTLILALLMVALMVASVYADAPVSDAFLEGYTTAVLERESGIPGATVTVRDGVVTVTLPPDADVDEEALRERLRAIRGARELVVRRAEAARAEPAPAGPSPSPAAPSDPDSPTFGLFLRPTVFSPLLADPRWPHFSASYVRYLDDELGGVGQTSFGETFSFVRGETESGWQWEAGPQAGVFAIFDMDTSSPDLVNADYYVSGYLAVRKDDLSLISRIYHQSSHLGDEFLLDTGITRRGRSYEGIDALVSYDLSQSLRLYGGAGYIYRVIPADLGRWSLHYGAEYRSPEAYVSNFLRPVAAVDIQHQEQSDWSCDISLRAGFQIEHPRLTRQQLQLLLEYYNGTNPNGQFFFTDQIEYYGIGLHVYF